MPMRFREPSGEWKEYTPPARTRTVRGPRFRASGTFGEYEATRPAPTVRGAVGRPTTMRYSPGGGAAMRSVAEVMNPAAARRRAQASVTRTPAARRPGALLEAGLTLEDIERTRQEIRAMAAQQRAPIMQLPPISTRTGRTVTRGRGLRRY